MTLLFKTMQKKSGLDDRISAQATGSIIGLGKSKRLAAMRQSVERQADKETSQHVPIRNKKDHELQQTRELIAQRIADIKATYPQAMQHKLFALRYGSDEKINQMSLKKLFNILNINQNLAKEFAEVKYRDD